MLDNENTHHRYTKNAIDYCKTIVFTKLKCPFPQGQACQAAAACSACTLVNADLDLQKGVHWLLMKPASSCNALLSYFILHTMLQRGLLVHFHSFHMYATQTQV